MIPDLYATRDEWIRSVEYRRWQLRMQFERRAGAGKPHWRQYRAWLEQIYLANDHGLTVIVQEELALRSLFPE